MNQNTPDFSNQIPIEPKYRDPKTDAKEPIFKNIPLGATILIAVIVLVHLYRWINQGVAQDIWTRQFAASSSDIFSLLVFKNDHPLHTMATLIVHQFIHSGKFHLIMNSLMLVQVGPLVEIAFNRGANILDYSQTQKTNLRIRGAVLFIVYFLLCGIIGAFGVAIFNSSNNVYGIGASGAICGIYGGYLFAIAKMTPKGQPVFSELAKAAAVFLFINVGLAALARVSDVIPIAWEAHLLGFIGGCLLFPVFYKLALR